MPRRPTTIHSLLGGLLVLLAFWAAPPAPGQDGGGPAILTRGRLDATMPGREGRPDLVLHVDDLKPVDRSGSSYRASGVDLDVYSVQGDLRELLESVRAARGVFALRTKGGVPRGFAEGRAVELEDAVLTRHRDAPIVPLVLTAPRLHAFPHEERYTSVGDDLVLVEGPDLEGSGRDVTLDSAAGELVLGRDAHMRFRTSGGRDAEFSAPRGGALVLRRSTADPDVVVAIAERGASLRLVGEPTVTIHADRIEVALRRAKAAPLELDPRLDPKLGFVIESARATGSVVVTRGRDRFLADDAQVDAPGGELRRVVLQHSPGARIGVRGGDGDWIDVLISGAGPLTLDVEGEVDAPRRARFEFLGPGELTVPARDLAVNFSDRLVGDARAATDHARLVATGDVVLVRTDARLETETLDLIVHGSVTDESIAQLTVAAEGPSQFDGRSPRGDVVHTTVSGGLAVRLVGERWFLDSATGVRIETGGEEWSQLTAGSLTDGDLFQRSFQAGGGIQFKSRWGAVTATSGTFRGRERVELHGRVEGSFDTADGRLEFVAETLHLTRSIPKSEAEPELFQLTADGLEGAEFVAGASTIQLTASRLRLDGRFTHPANDSDRMQLDDLEVEDAVTLDAKTAGGRYRVDADTLTIHRGDTMDEDGHWPMELSASNVSRLDIEGPGRALHASCDQLELRGRDTVDPVGSVLIATGDVRIKDRGAGGLEGRCERLRVDDLERIVLEPAPGGRVFAKGTLPGQNTPYALDADRIERGPERLVALAPVVRLDGTLSPAQGAISGALLSNARAGRLIATSAELVLDGGVRLEGKDPKGVDITVTAGRVVARPTPGALGKSPPETPERRRDAPLQDVVLDGGIEIHYGAMVLRGAEVSGEQDALRVLGAPGAPAVLEVAGWSLEAEWLSIDAVEFLVSAGEGILHSPPGPDAWSLWFASITPHLQGGESMLAIAAPRLVDGLDKVRADWASVWVLRETWQALGNARLHGEAAVPPPVVSPPAWREGNAADPFGATLLRLQSHEFAGPLRAIYATGQFEVTRQGEPIVSADEAYLDTAKNSFWLSEAKIAVRFGARAEDPLLRVDAARLETDESGRLVADHATLTTCADEKPHYDILTRQLTLQPRGDGRWGIGARSNWLRFSNGLALPLPSIGSAILDEQGSFEGLETAAGGVLPLKSVQLARDARFGATIGATFGLEPGDFGRWIARRFGIREDRLVGGWEPSVSWLSKRGPLVSAKLSLGERNAKGEPESDRRLEFFFAGIPDQGADRGVVRVDENDRPGGRFFGWLRGRYPIAKQEWIDVAYAGQTDGGAQAEFFEQDFLRWDRRATFVRWRKATDGAYFSAGASKRIDSFRSDVEELPSFGAYVGKRQVAELGSLSLLYGGSVDVGYLRRREGSDFQDVFSSLPGGAALGQDGAETVRGVLNQRFELVVPGGPAGVRAVPFVELGAAGWTKDLDDQNGASRFSVLGGVDLATSLYSVKGDGISVIAPHVGVRTDLAYAENGGRPASFDTAERATDGSVYTAGVRSLWTKLRTGDDLDFDVAVRRREGRSLEADTTEVTALGQWTTRVGRHGGGLIGLRHDGRYDVESGATTYSSSTLAWRPDDPFSMEGRYVRGLDIAGAPLFETVRVDARWTVDPKWEIEVLHSWNVAGGVPLSSGVTLRRFSHDFLLELGVSRRAGIGGTTFGISFRPLLGWRRARQGLFDRR